MVGSPGNYDCALTGERSESCDPGYQYDSDFMDYTNSNSTRSGTPASDCLFYNAESGYIDQESLSSDLNRAIPDLSLTPGVIRRPQRKLSEQGAVSDGDILAKSERLPLSFMNGESIPFLSEHKRTSFVRGRQCIRLSESEPGISPPTHSEPTTPAASVLQIVQDLSEHNVILMAEGLSNINVSESHPGPPTPPDQTPPEAPVSQSEQSSQKQVVSREERGVSGLLTTQGPSKNIYLRLVIVLVVVSVVLLIILIIIAVLMTGTPPLRTAPCEGDWILNRGTCYYFSTARETWDNSRRFCASHNSSLALIDSEVELEFLNRYKGIDNHWIGLRWDSSNNGWTWINGTLHRDHIFSVRSASGNSDQSECVYLNHEGVRGDRGDYDRKWICVRRS